MFKVLVSKFNLTKKGEVQRKIIAGELNHQFREPYNQNKLLSFPTIKQKKTNIYDMSLSNTKVEENDDPWAVDEDASLGWNIANETANNDKVRLSKIFLNYKNNI